MSTVPSRIPPKLFLISLIAGLRIIITELITSPIDSISANNWSFVNSTFTKNARSSGTKPLAKLNATSANSFTNVVDNTDFTNSLTAS